ncbi:MAG: 5-formyltetrahydrofolate cyclo-ligase [Candidatus Hydrogenedentota bacterium]
MTQVKHEIRREALAWRRSLGTAEAVAGSAAVCARVQTLPVFTAAPALAAYVASKDNEVDTRQIIETAWRRDMAVYVPATAPDRRLTWARLTDWTQLTPGRYGILEPTPALDRESAPPSSALCLTPGLAFAPDGTRIGYGGGYYDRFLMTFSGLSVGLAYEGQVYPALPAAPHDVRVGILVTEHAVYRCTAAR